VCQLQPLQQLVDGRPGATTSEVVQVSHQLQVLAAGVELVDGRELPGHADGSPHLIRVAFDVVAGDADRSAVRLEQSGADTDDCGLAGAVGPQERVHAPLRNVEVDALEHVIVAVALVQPGDRDCCVLTHASMVVG